LIENNLCTMVDRVLVVDVSESSQITRTMTRDNISLQEVNAILASQTNRTARLEVANEVINNDNTCLEEIKNLVLSLDKKYLALTKMV